MNEPKESKTATLGMSDEERSNIVVSFIKAYLDDKVKVIHPRIEDIKRNPERQKTLIANLKTKIEKEFGPAGIEEIRKLSKLSPADIEALSIENFTNLVRVVAGSEHAEEEEKRKAINGLFDQMLAFKIGGRLQGEFIGLGTLESRLRDAEEKLTRQTKLIEELEMLLRVSLGLSRGSQEQ